MTDQELLEQLQAAVRPHAGTVSRRGEGCASFLFITKNGRAIEASRHENGWWLEFWDSQEEGAAPITERTLRTNEEALAAILGWLR